MRTIYIDRNYLSHPEDGAGRRAVETAFFDGKCEAFVEGYRFIPASERWTREDGVEFVGEVAFPVANYDMLEEKQREEQALAAEMVGIVGEGAPIETAKALRNAMDVAADKLTDEEALENRILYSAWQPDIAYEAGNKRMYDDALYKCRQAHTSQTGWEPEAVPALWERIDETASGTKDDQIKAARNMEYFIDLYYLDSEDEQTYFCTRGTGQPVAYLPHELVGVYFEVAE